MRFGKGPTRASAAVRDRYTRVLAPVTFDQHPASVAVNPAMRGPAGVGPWGNFIMAGAPHVGVAVPTMVALNPDMTGARGRSGMFHHDGGWCDADYDIRSKRSEGKYGSQEK
jgi:hypothetical protein